MPRLSSGCLACPSPGVSSECKTMLSRNFVIDKSFKVRDITQIFANRAELMPVGETTEEHRTWQEEEASLVEKDRASTGPRGGLFRGCFKRAHPGFRRIAPFNQPIRDDEDGVDRCPRCTWELEDGLCQSCGYPSGDDYDDLSDSDDHLYGHPGLDPDEDDLESAMLDYIADGGHVHDFEGELSPAYLSDETYLSDVIPGDVQPFHNHFPGHHPDSGAESQFHSSDEETDEGSIDDDEYDSMDGFVVDDGEDQPPSRSTSPHSIHWASEEGAGVEDTNDDRGSVSGNDLDRIDLTSPSPSTAQYLSEDDSDEGPIAPARRQTSRRSITSRASGNDDSDSIDETPTSRDLVLAQRRRVHAIGSSHARLNIPHPPRHAPPNREISHRMQPITIDSDSEGPVPASQRTRRRRGRPIQLDVESGAETSSATATGGRHSPRPTSSRRNDRRQVPRADDVASPDMDESSQSRTNDQSGDRPPYENAFGPPLSTGRERASLALPPPRTNWPPSLSAALYRESHSTPQADSRSNQARHLSPHDRLGRNSGRLSPRSNGLSPAPESSRSQLRTAQETFEQGVRNRQARKAERRAERRRLKAGREQRRAEEATH